jgi:hypothetical protein
MERLILRMLFLSCLASIPFVFKRKNLMMHLLIFFAKGVLLTSFDSIFIKRKKIAYPIRPFAKVFDTNILFDLLFFPLLSVIWVRSTYNTKPIVTVLRSLWFSVPMSILQYFIEKKTKLFKWNDWTILDTFLSINFTLFLTRGCVGLLRKVIGQKNPAITNVKQSKSRLFSVASSKIRSAPPEPNINFEYEPINQSAIDPLHP